MTQPSRVLIIHGFNNNEAIFDPLKEVLETQGFEVVFITLPCHGENRTEAKEYEAAIKCFSSSMAKHTKHPNYSLIAFSQGGLFSQLWLQAKKTNLPKKQILLAPAFFINNSELIMSLLDLLPSFIPIQSVGPKKFRRYDRMSVWEYKILTNGIKSFESFKPFIFKVPTLLIGDPDDELVNMYKIKDVLSGPENEDNLNFKFWPRRYLSKKHGLGRHHLIVHSDYFTAPDWTRFVRKLTTFLQD